MSLEKIKPHRVRKDRGLFYRLIQTVLFIVKERLIGSRLFLLLYLLYTFSVVIGTVFLVLFSDIFLASPSNFGVDPVSLYYSLLILGFSLTTVNDLAFWIIVFSSANLLSEEIKSGLVSSYYSKPVPKFFYLASRVLSILFVLFFIAIIPIGVMVTVPVLRHPESFPDFGVLRVIGIMLISLLSTFIVFLFYIFLVSTIVAIVEDRGASVLVSFIVYYVSYLAGQILSIYLGKGFYLVSIIFWVMSLILVSLGVPWMNLDGNLFSGYIGDFLQVDLSLNPLIYVAGASLLLASTTALGLVSIYIYNNKGLGVELA